VQFVGYEPPHRLALYFAAADLQCFPTVYGAFGLVLIEGMACGCPAVVFDYPAMNEIVTPDCGYLVREPTAAAYAAAIQRALEDHGAKRKDAVRRSLQFDMEQQIDAIVGVYEEAARHHSSRTWHVTAGAV
jgi:D-inositol-3-phosphate glycosyltransferase